MPGFPNVRLANRPLHFFYLCDCSGSMAAQGKMQSLNQAIRQSLPGMNRVARDNPEARVLVRAVSFADQASWHIPEPTLVEGLEWRDLQAGGCTAMGAALELVAEQLRAPPMEERALPPVLVLISDGQPTDDFEAGLARLMREPWAQKAVRLSIALGHDADLEILQQFIGPAPANQRGRSPRRPLQASNATSLAQFIQWASTAVVGAASMPVSRIGESAEEGNIPLPDLPPTEMDPMDDIGPMVW
ncbi:VWA domain-containing protein [Cyanobium sp. WKJ7-Wakatipu]|uniref:vWA domain-containing protein n=1 Tax=Cyanobium sp. WKJ7-Wakatipu TaxID=2823726 RepID=UPI0020CF964C|nr:VWA domain-containing protein [Cyanobium sp. WKJ7-Wakatipu]MCP9784594.1 VWA domain-containing protein [Cyanobium sp. WKJ7-Wakatipu]